MPIKDISREEQSYLHLSGVARRETVKLTENDRANFNTKLPLQYYNNLAESMNEKDIGIFADTSADFSTDIVNPNSVTRLTSWPITVKSSIQADKRAEILDIVITAMDKFHWNATEITNYLKRELDTRFGCSWHVVAGEEFGFDVDFEEGQLLFFGSLAVLIWKCGTQLLKEVKYKTEEDEEMVKKAKMTKSSSKYSKVFY